MRNALIMLLLVPALLTGVCDDLEAQEQPANYDPSARIEAEPLDPERAKILSEFVGLPVQKQNRSALRGAFCKSNITQPTPSATQIKLALALVETDITPILSFQDSTTEGSRGTSIQYSIDFGLDAVTLRSSNPRYPSQVNGLRIAYPRDTTLPVWFEAKDDASILFFVPPVRDCNVQFVVACPRTYSKTRVLEESQLTFSGVTYLIASKADGLFKAPTGAEGKIVASARASSRITLPTPSSTEDVSSDTPSASFKIQKPLDALKSPHPFTPITLPIADAIEARLECGTKESLMRVVRSRATIELTETKLELTQGIRIERSDVPVNPGSCIVISRRTESHY